MGGAGRPAGGPSHLHWTVSPFHDLLPTQQDTAGCLIAKCPRFLDKDSLAQSNLCWFVQGRIMLEEDRSRSPIHRPARPSWTNEQ